MVTSNLKLNFIAKPNYYNTFTFFRNFLQFASNFDNFSNISRDVDSEVGGSDSSLNSHSTSLTTTLPRLSHYNSQPTIGGQSRSSKTGAAGGQGPGPRIVKTIIKRLPRDSGPQYGSLDRKHSRS